jgi:hypothetical protein
MRVSVGVGVNEVNSVLIRANSARNQLYMRSELSWSSRRDASTKRGRNQEEMSLPCLCISCGFGADIGDYGLRP